MYYPDAKYEVLSMIKTALLVSILLAYLIVVIYSLLFIWGDQYRSTKNKVCWMLVLIFTGPIGIGLYFYEAKP